MSNRLLELGVLGSLTFTNYLLEWTVILGDDIATLAVLYGVSSLRLRSDLDPARQDILQRLERSFSIVGIAGSPTQMLEDCGEDISVLSRQISLKVQENHGNSACALGLLAQLARGMKIYFDNQTNPDEIIPGIAADVSHYCPDLTVDVPRFARVLEMQGLGNLNTSRLCRLIVRLSMPVTVLILSADARNEKRLRIGQERRELDNVIREGRLKEALLLEDVPSCRVRDITQALDMHKPTILQFSGHGDSEYIIFEDDIGNAKPVHKTDLAHLLAAQDGLELVILNACYSSDLAQTIANGVGCAIGMDRSVLDKDCVFFAREFYQALLDGRPIEAAFTRAKLSLGLTSSMQVHFFKRRTESTDWTLLD